MTVGPHEARLRAVLATADAGVVDTAALEWGAGAQLLDLVAGALENAAPAIGSQGYSGSALCWVASCSGSGWCWPAGVPAAISSGWAGAA